MQIITFTHTYGTFINLMSRFHQQKLIILSNRRFSNIRGIDCFKDSTFPAEYLIEGIFTANIVHDSMDDFSFTNVNRTLPLALLYANSKTGSGEATHLDQVIELDVP